MKAKDVLASDDWQRCAAFHGHVCPGLAMGFVMAKAALAWLEETRAPDEEIVAVAETDACCVDAVQVLTGCTFGKGNFRYRDLGKTAFTFFSRTSGRGVRIAAKAVERETPEPDKALADRNAWAALKQRRLEELLEQPVEANFSITEVALPLPEKAVIQPSAICPGCGEPTMPAKMVESGGKRYCRDCVTHLTRNSKF